MTESSGRHPWDPDVELSAVFAAELIADLDARFRDSAVTPVPGGWDFHTFSVDDEWIFRFPKREEVCASLRTEWRVLDALTAVSLPYAVPRHELRSEGTARYPRPFSGYPICPGWPLIERHSRLATGVDTFLEFLDIISGVAVEAPTETMRDLSPWASESRARLRTLELDERLRSATADLLDRSPRWSERAVFQHNDLGPDHLLCIGGSVTAVIDWADACYADPAADLAGAVIAWGLEPVRAARRRDDAFWHRVRFRAALGGVSMLWFGQTAQRREYVEWGLRVLDDVAVTGTSD